MYLHLSTGLSTAGVIVAPFLWVCAQFALFLWIWLGGNDWKGCAAAGPLVPVVVVGRLPLAVVDNQALTRGCVVY